MSEERIPFAFHHVGVVTSDLAQSRALYERLGYTASPQIDDPVQKIAILLLERADGPMIELVCPTDPSSPAAGWLKRIRAGTYHTCYEVRSIADAADFLRDAAFTPIGAPVPALAFGGRSVMFLWGKDVGLVELLEAEDAAGE